jgi:hypothetical protein
VIRIDAIWLATEPMEMRADTHPRLVKHAIARYLLAETLIGSPVRSGYIFYC